MLVTLRAGAADTAAPPIITATPAATAAQNLTRTPVLFVRLPPNLVGGTRRHNEHRASACPSHGGVRISPLGFTAATVQVSRALEGPIHEPLFRRGGRARALR